MKIQKFTIFFIFIFSVEAYALSEAMQLMKVSCEKRGEPKACYNLANMYLNNEDSIRAENYFEMACKMEYKLACDRKRWEKPVANSKNKSIQETAKFLTHGCEKLFTSLAACEEFECSQPNPLVSGEKIGHKVTSQGLDKFCKYSYSLTKKSKMVCFMEKKLAKRFRNVSEKEGFNILSRFRKNGICNEKVIIE